MDDCKNGVDAYLYSVGILLVVCNGFGVLPFLWRGVAVAMDNTDNDEVRRLSH